MYSPEIVLLDGEYRHFRASVLKARGYRVFTTQHVVEVCLHWTSGGCAALVIGSRIHWSDVATLCDWIKMNDPEKRVILLSDRRSARRPAPIDAVVPTQPVQALLESLRSLLPITAGDQNCRVEVAAVPNEAAALEIPERVRIS